MSLDRILRAVDTFREPGEPMGVLIGSAEGQHVVRVLVGRECVTYIEAPTRDEAVTRALAELEEAAAIVENLRGTLAIVEATTW